MKRFLAFAGDAVEMTARDVAHIRTGPITSGLTGSVTLYDEANTPLGSFPVVSGGGDDWYAEVTAPITEGIYRAVMVLVVGGAQRTAEAELRVT